MNIEENFASRQPKWKFRLSTEPNFTKKVCEMIEKFSIILLLSFTVILGSSVLSENVKKKNLKEEIVRVPQASFQVIKFDSLTTPSSLTTAAIISGKISRNDTISTNSTETSSASSSGSEELAALKNETKTIANQTFPLLKVSKTHNQVTAKKVPATASLVKETRSSGSYTDIRDFMGN